MENYVRDPELTGIIPAQIQKIPKRKEKARSQKTALAPHRLAEEKGHLGKQLQLSKVQLDLLDRSGATAGSGSCGNKGQRRGSGAWKSPVPLQMGRVQSSWKHRAGGPCFSGILGGTSFRSFC